MITIILCAIIVMAIFIYTEIREWGFDFDVILIAVPIGMLGAVGGFVLATALPMDTYDKHYSLNIESLQDGGNVSGDFFLGCGQIDGEMKYVFYYEESDLYRMMQVNYDLVQIKYSEGKPKVNITQICPTGALINNFAFDADCWDKTYIIEVPKGTIKNNYSLDAQ